MCTSEGSTEPKMILVCSLCGNLCYVHEWRERRTQNDSSVFSLWKSLLCVRVKGAQNPKWFLYVLSVEIPVMCTSEGSAEPKMILLCSLCGNPCYVYEWRERRTQNDSSVFSLWKSLLCVRVKGAQNPKWFFCVLSVEISVMCTSEGSAEPKMILLCSLCGNLCYVYEWRERRTQNDSCMFSLWKSLLCVRVKGAQNPKWFFCVLSVEISVMCTSEGSAETKMILLCSLCGNLCYVYEWRERRTQNDSSVFSLWKSLLCVRVKGAQNPKWFFCVLSVEISVMCTSEGSAEPKMILLCSLCGNLCYVYEWRERRTQNDSCMFSLWKSPLCVRVKGAQNPKWFFCVLSVEISVMCTSEGSAEPKMILLCSLCGNLCYVYEWRERRTQNDSCMFSLWKSLLCVRVKGAQNPKWFLYVLSVEISVMCTSEGSVEPKMILLCSLCGNLCYVYEWRERRTQNDSCMFSLWKSLLCVRVKGAQNPKWFLYVLSVEISVMCTSEGSAEPKMILLCSLCGNLCYVYEWRDRRTQNDSSVFSLWKSLLCVRVKGAQNPKWFFCVLSVEISVMCTSEGSAEPKMILLCSLCGNLCYVYEWRERRTQNDSSVFSLWKSLLCVRVKGAQNPKWFFCVLSVEISVMCTSEGSAEPKMILLCSLCGNLCYVYEWRERRTQNDSSVFSLWKSPLCVRVKGAQNPKWFFCVLSVEISVMCTSEGSAEPKMILLCSLCGNPCYVYEWRERRTQNDSSVFSLWKSLLCVRVKGAQNPKWFFCVLSVEISVMCTSEGSAEPKMILVCSLCGNLCYVYEWRERRTQNDSCMFSLWKSLLCVRVKGAQNPKWFFCVLSVEISVMCTSEGSVEPKMILLCSLCGNLCYVYEWRERRTQNDSSVFSLWKSLSRVRVKGAQNPKWFFCVLSVEISVMCTSEGSSEPKMILVCSLCGNLCYVYEWRELRTQNDSCMFSLWKSLLCVRVKGAQNPKWFLYVLSVEIPVMCTSEGSSEPKMILLCSLCGNLCYVYEWRERRTQNDSSVFSLWKSLLCVRVKGAQNPKWFLYVLSVEIPVMCTSEGSVEPKMILLCSLCGNLCYVYEWRERRTQNDSCMFSLWKSLLCVRVKGAQNPKWFLYVLSVEISVTCTSEGSAEPKMILLCSLCGNLCYVYEWRERRTQNYSSVFSLWKSLLCVRVKGAQNPKWFLYVLSVEISVMCTSEGSVEPKMILLCSLCGNLCYVYEWRERRTQNDSCMFSLWKSLLCVWVKGAQTVPSRVKLFSMKPAVCIRRSSFSSMADSASCLSADQALNSCSPITFREEHSALQLLTTLIQHWPLKLYLLGKAQRP